MKEIVQGKKPEPSPKISPKISSYSNFSGKTGVLMRGILIKPLL